MAFGLDDAYFVSQGLNTIYTMAHDSRSLQKEATPEWMVNAAYNTPANQVARLREAGLNPNLAYGAVNTGNISGTGSRTGLQKYDKGFGDTLGFLNSLVSLGTALSSERRANQEIELRKRDQDLDSLKFVSQLSHQQDALDLERLRMELELARDQRDYNFKREEFDWKKSTYRPSQDSPTTLLTKILTNTVGKHPADVATDTHNLLKSAFGFAAKANPLLGGYSLYQGLRPYLGGYLKNVGKGVSKGKY